MEEAPSDDMVEALIERWAGQTVQRVHELAREMDEVRAQQTRLADERAGCIARLAIRFSAAEVGERLGISRQSVYEAIKRDRENMAEKKGPYKE